MKKPPPSDMDRFTEFARRIVAVPKAEVDEKSREYQKTRRAKRAKKRT